MVEKQRGGTPHNTIEALWPCVQTRVGRPHKILRCFRTRGGTLHLPFEDIWSDVQTKVGTKYKIQAFLTEVVGGWVDGIFRGNDATL